MQDTLPGFWKIFNFPAVKVDSEAPNWYYLYISKNHKKI